MKKYLRNYYNNNKNKDQNNIFPPPTSNNNNSHVLSYIPKNTLKLKINEKEYEIQDQNLIQFLMNLTLNSNSENQKIPKQINEKSLLLFFNLLSDNISNSHKSDSLTFLYIRKLINICIFLNLTDIIEIVVTEYIEPKITKQTSILILNNFIDLLFSQEKVKNIFISVIKKSIYCISLNLIEFITSKKNELFSLSSEIIEEIIETYIINNEDKNLGLILETLAEVRKVKGGIFDLMENERKSAIKNFVDNDPVFEWKINYDLNNNNGIYEEKQLLIDDLNINLICYYDSNKDILQMAVQILGINDDNNSTISNTSTAKYLKTNLFNNNDLKETISFLYSCEIQDINYKSRTNFNCIQLPCKSRFLIFKLENFMNILSTEKYSNNNNIINKEFTAKFYFNRNYIFPSIIQHVSENLKIYSGVNNSIAKIPKLALTILLNNDINNNINKSQNELYKIKIIEKWLKDKNNYSVKNIEDLYKNIKWEYFRNEELINFFFNKSELLSKNKSIKNDIFFEIQKRFQNEYLNFFQINNKEVNINYSTSQNLFSDINSSFTFDFLTNILNNINVLKKFCNGKKKTKDNEKIILSEKKYNNLNKINNINLSEYRNISCSNLFKKKTKSIDLYDSPYYNNFLCNNLNYNNYNNNNYNNLLNKKRNIIINCIQNKKQNLSSNYFLNNKILERNLSSNKSLGYKYKTSTPTIDYSMGKDSRMSCNKSDNFDNTLNEIRNEKRSILDKNKIYFHNGHYLNKVKKSCNNKLSRSNDIIGNFRYYFGKDLQK